MPCKKITVLILFVTLFVGVGIILGSPAPVQAQSTDISCRGCHGGNQRSLTLSSGETLPLLVELDKLDSSPHSSLSEAAVSCLNCHENDTRYQYPHLTNPAHDYKEFVAAVSGQCQDCHYAHQPFHDEEALGAESPTCVDCHGSHDIAAIDDLAESMPARCVTCHTDQPEGWAAEFVAPLPGLGEGAAGYAGSIRCAGCHDDLYFNWHDTQHAHMIQEPGVRPGAIVGDFEVESAVRTFTLNDVAYTVGGRWRQLYLTPNDEEQLELLPAQWNVEAEEWVPYEPEHGTSSNWIQSCGSCHVTGLNTETWGFTEFSIGCESCHGPAKDHSKDPENVKPYRAIDDQVCGACHSQGTSPDGHPFAASYQPGDILSEHFTLTDDPEAKWPDGSARLNHQQYADWQLGSSMSLAAETSCLTCHVVHSQGAVSSQLRAPLNDLCLECHNDQRALIRHVPFHEQAMNERDFTCVDCHMPKTVTGIDGISLHNHSFLQPNPEASIAHGGIEMMPNACNVCHTEIGQDEEWAAQTIAYAKAVGTPASSAYFGPGPTPISPPPPTPISVAGQPSEHVFVPTGRWVRNIAIALFGIILLIAVVAAGNNMRIRRSRNV